MKNTLSTGIDIFSRELTSAGPSSELGDFAHVYSPLIGSWHVRAADHLSDGSRQESEGEWHFSWILEGRAIQDVLICPGVSERTPDMSKTNNRYGTTIRFFDLVTHRWKMNWFNPVTGARNELVVRRYPDRIEQTGQDEGLLLRWTFSQIQPQSFYWLGEYSENNGQSWVKRTEFFAIRK